MIKITHKKRYETTKKIIKEKQHNIKFIPYQDNHAIVIETNYNIATILDKDEIKEVKLSKNYKTTLNKIIYPGDKVTLTNNEITGIITRKNILSRDKYDSTKLNSTGTKKIIATNIDLAIIVVSANNPPLHPKFIDRYMILLNNSHIPFIICVNKSDLITKKEEDILNIYESLNIPLIKTSTYTKEGIEKLKEYLQDKQAIFVGHSGVGKSSLTNELMNDNTIKTGKLRDKNKRGCHTTTTSTYYKWNSSSSIIDTPGIRSLDISNYNIEDIKNYFQEFNQYSVLCKYKDCLHYDEPLTTCYIKQMVNDGRIIKERYESYYKIITDIKRK